MPIKTSGLTSSNKLSSFSFFFPSLCHTLTWLPRDTLVQFACKTLWARCLWDDDWDCPPQLILVTEVILQLSICICFSCFPTCCHEAVIQYDSNNTPSAASHYHLLLPTSSRVFSLLFSLVYIIFREVCLTSVNLCCGRFIF